MLVDLSRDRVQAFPGIVERAAHTAALTETAAFLASAKNPGEAAETLRFLQDVCDRNPAIARATARLLESNRPSAREYVRANGLRSLRLPASARQQRPKGKLLGMSAAELWDAATNGKVPVAETAQRRKSTGLLQMTPDQLWAACTR